MKKISLSLFFILFVLISSAQEVYHAYEAGIATFSKKFDRWIYDSPRSADLTFIFQQRVLIVNDRKHSTYVLGEQFQDEKGVDTGILGWYAVDEDGKDCAVKFVFYRSGPVRMQIACIYGDSCFYYNVTRVNK